MRNNRSRKSKMLKYVNTLSYANTVPITIDYIPDPIVAELACDSYNEYHKYDGRRISVEYDGEFVERIKRNYIRHELTNYDEILSVVHGEIGYGEAYDTIKNRVTERIDETWKSQNTIITSEEWNLIVKKVMALYNHRYITYEDLKMRGWNNTIAQTLRLKPDKRLMYPYNNGRPPISLYLVEKVEALEKTNEFTEWLQKLMEERDIREKRESERKSMNDALEQEKSKLIGYINSAKLEINYVSEPKLTELACNSYNYFHIYEKPRVSIYDDEKTLNEVKKEYILHTLTNYDDIMQKIQLNITVKHDRRKYIRKALEDRLTERIEIEWQNKQCAVLQ
jgi:hypothetical protein